MINEEVLKESDRIRKKYPDRYPIIITKSKTSSLVNLTKSKYLVPGDITVGQFQYVIRNRINLRADQALFLFCNNKLPNISDTISNVYENLKSPDGMLYMIYTEESVFGN